jgi:hypothetical protein
MDDLITMSPSNSTMDGSFRNSITAIINQWLPFYVATSRDTLNILTKW